jgi:sugar phosphate isomerase/epimerase
LFRKIGTAAGHRNRMKTSRRNFIKTASVVTAGGFLAPKIGRAFISPALPDPGIQLFTFFNVIDNDVTGTLKKVSELGYRNIESAFSKKGGYYGLKPRDFASMLKDLGMSWKSHHVLGAPFKLPPGAKPPTGADGKPISIPPMKNLRDNYQELVDEAAEGGVQYLVCANTPFSTAEDLKSSLSVLNKTAEVAKKAGLQFAYHNHDGEFRPVDGQVPYDLFLNETDKEFLKFELDIAWAVKGGADPIALFERHPKRFPLWHVKDLDREHKKILPVGEGVVDYKKYFPHAESSGLVYYFVEHDMPENPFDSVTKSLKFIRQL